MKTDNELRATDACEPDCKLTEIHMTEREGVTAEFRGEAVKAFAGVFVDWFREMGGESFVVCSLNDPKTGEEYTLTMQKAGGKTPVQELRELRLRLDAAPIIDTCDNGHKFAKLPDHPVRDGLARCPHCMATGLDSARSQLSRARSAMEVNDPGNAREIIGEPQS